MLKLKHPDYFEGILQLRNPTDELVDFIRRTVSSDAKALISKEKMIKNAGIDFYLGSQKYLQSLGKKIKQTFPGVIKVNAKLFTRSRTGKDLYRVNVLFKFVDIKKGKVIKLKGEEYEVIGWDRKVLLKNTRSGKKLQVSFEAIDASQNVYI